MRFPRANGKCNRAGTYVCRYLKYIHIYISLCIDIDRLVVRFAGLCQISDIMRRNKSSCTQDDKVWLCTRTFFGTTKYHFVLHASNTQCHQIIFRTTKYYCVLQSRTPDSKLLKEQNGVPGAPATRQCPSWVGNADAGHGGHSAAGASLRGPRFPWDYCSSGSACWRCSSTGSTQTRACASILAPMHIWYICQIRRMWSCVLATKFCSKHGSTGYSPHCCNCSSMVGASAIKPLKKKWHFLPGMMDFKRAVERTAFPLTPASTWRCTQCKVQRATQASSCIGNLHKELQVM